jgi:oxaloacetate decarboxylase beta subunit
MLLANIPGAGLFHMDLFINESGAPLNFQEVVEKGGLLDFIYLGVKLVIYPPLIFLGIGAMTDFSPLIANPSSLLLGAAAQFGIFVAFVAALALGFTPGAGCCNRNYRRCRRTDRDTCYKEPCARIVRSNCYSGLFIHGFSALYTAADYACGYNQKERAIMMQQLRDVSKTEQIVFPIAVTLIVSIVLPDATPLIGMLMLGNLLKVTGVVDACLRQHRTS